MRGRSYPLRSQYQTSPTTEPNPRRRSSGLARQRSLAENKPTAFNLAFIRRLIPGKSVSFSDSSARGSSSIGSITRPSGFRISVPTFARNGLGPIPMEAVMYCPTSSRSVRFISRANSIARAGRRSSPRSLKYISSMLQTRSIGSTRSTASRMRSWYWTYTRPRAGVRTKPGHIRLASPTLVPVLTPKRLAS
ncbi:MAG: hypothetical protein CNCCGFBP_01919 [Fimbriimonadaceae bacterium]|nr:hypothetical protein [Fimbriimonadaceae bacterium]